MAIATEAHAVEAGAFNRIAGIFHAVVTTVQKRRVYRLTLSELSKLSDRELDDLGISRGNLHTIARRAAYGA